MVVICVPLAEYRQRYTFDLASEIELELFFGREGGGFYIGFLYRRGDVVIIMRVRWIG